MGTPTFTIVDVLPTVESPRKGIGGQPRKEDTPLREKNRRTHARLMGQEVVPSPADAPDEIPEDAVALTDDLAATVVRKTMRRLAAGQVQPSLKEGLAAQTILDRRAEKAADRRFMLNLAQAMAGGGVATPTRLLPAPDEGLIEGDFEDVSDANLAPAHLRSEP